MKLKPQPKIKNPYTLRMRVYTNDGHPRDWQDKGTGEFRDLKTVQKQIMMMKSTHLNKRMEIEWEKDGKLLDFNGKEIGKAMDFNVRER